MRNEEFVVAVYVDYPSISEFSLDRLMPLRPTHLFLELPERLSNDAEGMILGLRDTLRQRGLTVSAGIRPIPMVEGGDNPAVIGNAADATESPCYQSEPELNRLEALSVWAAENFDEVIFDDGIMTTCTCGRCVEEKGMRTWAEYRMQKMVWVTEEHLIKPIKRVNRNCQAVVKFPQWLESLQHVGYDVRNHVRNFDRTAVGIETRDSVEQHQHIPPYGSYVLYRWFASVAQEKIYPYAWLDNFGQDEHVYMRQIYQAMLAGAEGVILWCHSTHTEAEGRKHREALAGSLAEINRMRQQLRQPRGVPIYMPVNSDGEYFIQPHLGMLGIPLAPCPKFPEQEPVVILTEHAMVDETIAEKILNHLRKGGDILATSGLIKRLERTDIGQVISDRLLDGQVSGDRYRLDHWNHSFKGQEVTIPFVYRHTWPAAVVASVVTDSMDHPLIAKYPYFSGNLYMLTVPTVQTDLYKYPPPVLERLRRFFEPHLGVWLDGAAEIGFYPYANCSVLVNFTGSPQEVAVCGGDSTRHEVNLEPHEVKIVQSD